MKTGEPLQQASGLVSHLLATPARCLRSMAHTRPLQVIGLVIVLIALLRLTIAKLPAKTRLPANPRRGCQRTT